MKGAAATTLYGTEASAGVIQIFTKKGISGAPIWNARGERRLQPAGVVPGEPAKDPTDLYTKCGNLDELYSLKHPGKDERSHLGQP